mgnify:FL=1
MSTRYLHTQNIDSILKQQTDLGKTQLQISTGKRILTPSDDPVASVKILDFERQINVSQQYMDNADVATNKLQITDVALDSSMTVLQRVRELAVQGLSDTNNAGSRQAIAEEINQLNELMVGYANTSDSNGEYLFSGYQVDQQPYDGTFNYLGDTGQRNIRVGSGYIVEVNEPGSEVFTSATVSGPTQAIFATIKSFADALTANTVGTAPNDGEFLTNIDTSMDAVLNARVRVGTRQNAIDQQKEVSGAVKLNMTTMLSQVQDLDYSEAISQLELQKTGLQAAQQSFIKVRGLSLFNYL